MDVVEVEEALEVVTVEVEGVVVVEVSSIVLTIMEWTSTDELY